jgi:protein SDA1
MEGDDAVESDEEDGSELIEDEEMGSDGEADDSDEAGGSDLEELEEDSDSEEINDEDESGKISRKRPLESEVTEGDDDAGPSTSQKRQKLESSVIEEAANTSQSLRHLKKMYAAKVEKKVVTEVVSRDGDGILSNEDFKRIRDLQAKRAAKAAMAEHGLSKAGKFRQEIAVKLDKHGNLNEKRVNPAHLEARIHKRQEKEERQASARAGREDRPLFGARTAMKQRKTGGTSNKQKEKSKGMPLAAKRAIIKRTSSKKKMGRRTAEKQFRGKKAWK